MTEYTPDRPLSWMTVNQGGECNTLGISNRDALLMTLSIGL